MTIANKLQLLALKGYCPALVNDDNGNWALSFSALVSGWASSDRSQVAVLIEEHEWKPTIEEAVDYAISKLEEE